MMSLLAGSAPFPATTTDVGPATPRPPLRTAIATVCISGTLEDKLAAAAAAGFDGVEIFEPDFVVSSSSAGDVRRRCADLGLSIDLYQPFRDLDSTDPDQFARNLRRGMRISYEALAWGTHVNTFDRSWDIVSAADHPALGVCLDSFHILSRGSDP